MNDRHQMLITLDSLRHDVFNAATMPFLKSFPRARALTHGTYTLPAHTSFFAGKLPCTFAGLFDTGARSNRRPEGVPLWRLTNPESFGPGLHQLVGRDIVDGFNRKNYRTIGTGGVNWFDPQKPAHIQTIDHFARYRWFGGHTHGAEQVQWVAEEVIASDRPCFIFINFGETHHPFYLSAKEPRTEYRHGFAACFAAQRRCAEFLDSLIGRLLTSKALKNTDAIICSDHGDCFGEDGLYGHGFAHEKVLEVPIVQVRT